MSTPSGPPPNITIDFTTPALNLGWKLPTETMWLPGGNPNAQS